MGCTPLTLRSGVRVGWRNSGMRRPPRPCVAGCFSRPPPVPSLTPAHDHTALHRQVAVNLDRRTGFVKGYALVEYATRKEAEKAIADLNGAQLLGKPVCVEWAFVQGGGAGAGRGGRR